MTLRIEIVSGPGAGTVHVFEDDVDVVEIGRDTAHCRVTFPADFTSVGRRHVAIRNSGGHYGLETNLRNPVLIDGREPFDGEPLEGVHVLQLGEDGPSLKITTSIDSALPETRIGTAMLSPSQETRRSAGRLRLALWATLALVFVLAGFGGWLYVERERESRQVAELVAKLEKVENTEVIAPSVLRDVAKSVYLVLILSPDSSETPVGTAWVYDGGVLATNAHVAAAFNQRTPGDTMIVRSSVSPYSTFRVETVAVHPDYERFTQAWEKFKPFRSVGGDVEVLDAPGEGYDVALLYTEPGGDLGPALTVADASEIDALQAGDAVAYAGFPMEKLASGGTNPVAPVPQIQLGNVTALSDYFLLPVIPAERYLIQHSIPATGGASGSPMVNRKGHVVGLISGINIIQTEDGARAPNAVNINFAQRADLLVELPDGPSAERHALRELAWNMGFSTYKDPMEAIPQKVLSEWLAANPDAKAGDVTPVMEEEIVLPFDEGEEIFFRRFGDALVEPGRYLILALSPSRSDIDLSIFSGEEEEASDKALDWYPSLIATKEDSAPLDVIVSSGAQEQAPDAVIRIWRMPLAAEDAAPTGGS